MVKKTVIVNRDRFKDNPELQKEVMMLVSGKSPEQVEELLNKQVQVAGRPLSEFVRIMNREEKEHGIKFYPHVVEPSFGVERCLYLSVLSAYREKKDRVVLALPKDLAPYQVAVFPLLERDELIKKAREIYNLLSGKYEVLFDDAGSIGKRYARVDEIGVPYAVTVDPQTLSDDSVTIRDRDSWSQIRIKTSDLESVMDKLFSGQDFSMLTGEAKR